MPHRAFTNSLASGPSRLAQHGDHDGSSFPAAGGSSTASEGVLPAGPSRLSAEHDGDMVRQSTKPKDSISPKSSIDIALDSPFLTLKGTGPDVEPTHLSGNVVLFLTEATSFKEITLEFKGKAKIPVPASESMVSNSASLTYNICNHHWSFLDLGMSHHKHSSRTLKAGRHLFPFSLEIGGSLPSTVATSLMGGASVSYKLHAIATYGHKIAFAFPHTLHHTTPVTLLRSFSSSALEYNQTLEIENTWPGKLMYSIILPHKAWAQGDTLGVLVKFSPTEKGVGVHSILTNLEEKTTVSFRSGQREETVVVASSKHEIVDGKRAILVDSNSTRLWIGFASPPKSPLPFTPTEETDRAFAGGEWLSTRPSTPTHPCMPFSLGPSHASGSSTPAPEVADDDQQVSPTDLVTTLFLPIPANTTTIHPSHSLEPITISHRVRWAAYITNPDGHISELRFSLPIIILDGRLLNDSRRHTLFTRRSVLSEGGLIQTALAGNNDEQGDADVNLELEAADRELPSYSAHVRDRVANMYIPEGATLRVTNPWVSNGTSPTSPSGPATTRDGLSAPGALDALSRSLQNHTPSSADAAHDLQSGVSSASGSVQHSQRSTLYVPNRDHSRFHPYPTPPGTRATSLFPSTANSRPGSRPMSGHQTPLDPPLDSAEMLLHLPHAPVNGQATPLDWVNSELLLSLSDEPERRFEREIEISRRNGTGSGPPSRSGSRPPSRVGSRPVSPCPGAIRDGSANGSSGHGGASKPSSTYGGHGKHGLTGFLKGAMKGFGFTKHHHLDDAPHDTHLPPAGHHSDTCSSAAPSPPGSATSRSNSRSTSPVRMRTRARSRPPPIRSNTTNAIASSSSMATSLPRSHHLADRHHALASSPLPRTSSTGSFPALMHSPGARHGHLTPGVGDEHLLHRAFTEVPDYSVAARGFIGGVAPLSSLAGLPSYAEVTRERERESHGRIGDAA